MEIASVIRQNYHGPAEFRPQVDPGMYIPKKNPGVLFMKYRERHKDMWSDSGRVLTAAFLAKFLFIPKPAVRLRSLTT